MDMSSAAGKTTVHASCGYRLLAILDMATCIIWSRYHRRLPFTVGELPRRPRGCYVQTFDRASGHCSGGTVPLRERSWPR